MSTSRRRPPSSFSFGSEMTRFNVTKAWLIMTIARSWSSSMPAMNEKKSSKKPPPEPPVGGDSPAALEAPAPADKAAEGDADAPPGEARVGGGEQEEEEEGEAGR